MTDRRCIRPMWLNTFTRNYPGQSLLMVALIVWAAAPASSQQVSPSPKPKDDVVRVFTELVQTDVMVFDKQGHFVKDLKQTDFELRIDGRVRPIQSFDQISAGSDEETQLAAARGVSGDTARRAVPLDRGRTVFFFVDDLHMDLAGLTAARKVISNFVEKEMGQNDQAAIATATGQLGFLQQLTDNRLVLKTALERLSPRSYSVRDFERPQMGEYEALLIDRSDFDVLDFFIAETMRLNPGINRDMAAGIVRNRAQAILAQSGMLSVNMLLGLERLVRSARDLPGRKVVFLLSNGFLVENRRSDSLSRLHEITANAARSGVVIYSLDTRGLVASLDDSTGERAFDPSGRLENATHGELAATQDGLNALAQDTGGRALFNTNDLTQGLAPAMKETSIYYLLAWRPESSEEKPGNRFRKLEVSVIGRPDLFVRVRKGYFDVDPSASAASRTAKQTNAAKPIIAQLKDAILAAYPRIEIPVTLGLNYYDVADAGATLSTSVQLPGEFVEFGQQPDGKIQAVVDLSGVFYNDRGQPSASFGQRIVTTAPSLEAAKDFNRDLTYTYLAKLTPGLYQVRVAVRDDKSGRIGSTNSWISIPDLSQKKLTLSSLLLGEYRSAGMTNVSNIAGPNQAILSPSHRFRRDSTLRLLVFTYNAALSSSEQKPDIAVQVQVVRDDQPVVTTSLRKIHSDGVIDLQRIPYAAEVSLEDLLPGRYVLQVSVIDRVAKTSATQQTHFDIY